MTFKCEWFVSKPNQAYFELWSMNNFLWTPIMCVFRMLLWANVLPHSVHRNCRSTPHSNRKCRIRLNLCLYRRPHALGHGRIGSSAGLANEVPGCSRPCVRNCSKAAIKRKTMNGTRISGTMQIGTYKVLVIEGSSTMNFDSYEELRRS